MPTDPLSPKTLRKLVQDVVATYGDARGVHHLEGLPLPDRAAILAAVANLRFVVFPGYTDPRTVSRGNVDYVIGDLINRSYETLTREIEVAYRYRCRVQRCEDCNCARMAARATRRLLRALPRIRERLKTDVAAHYHGDPAAESYDEIILAYPGIQAIALHRIAHELYLAKVPLVPRIISEHAHSRTGIDIHPGAKIGDYFFIDHGTGVVIGETTRIGDNVKIYMGVTLGALAPAKGQSLRGVKRHPTIRDDVTIYAGATILGGKTVIGRGSTINGNVFLTQSVPAYTQVGLGKPDLVFLSKKDRPSSPRPKPRKEDWVCPARPVCEADRRRTKSSHARGKRTKRTSKRNSVT